MMAGLRDRSQCTRKPEAQNKDAWPWVGAMRLLIIVSFLGSS